MDDHVMLAGHGSRERSVEEYTKIFKSANSGFSLVGVTGHGENDFFSLLEYKYSKPA